jgi:inhibitor of cysteine peptidase
MRKMLLLATGIVVLAAALGGCAPAPTPAPDHEQPPLNPDEPVTSDDDAQGPGTEPIEGEVVVGEAVVESIEIMILESFPVQVRVVASGYLPDACTQLGEITTTREGKTFEVTIATIRPADKACAAVVVDFQETIPLDVYGLEAGEYTVIVNGVSDTFRLEMDNKLEDEPVFPAPATPEGDQGQSRTGRGGGEPTGLAHIAGVEVQTASDPPVVVIRGWLSDACTRLYGITEERTGNRILLTVETTRPKDMACAQVIKEFEEHYTLQSDLEPGDYVLIVNDVTVEFSVP